MSDPSATEKDASYQAGYDAAKKEAEEGEDWERDKAFFELNCQEGRTLATMLRSLPKYDGTGTGDDVRSEIYASMRHIARKMRGDA